MARTDPTNDYSAPRPPPCEGCGGIAHGSVNAERACLIASLRKARAEGETLRRVRAEVAALTPFQKPEGTSK